LLGAALAAVQILPLGVYLTKSSVWHDRQREHPAWWAPVRPRLLDAVCTAIPYAYGSQRRGHPNLAKALGVNNLNESAGGYVGLAALIWLAPLAVVNRHRCGRVAFLAGMVLFAALGAFRLPPVDNLLRALPILEVTDNRRLTLWIAFGVTLLAAMGLDDLGQSRRLARGWLAVWVVAAVAIGSVAASIRSFEPTLRERSLAHYEMAAAATPGADPVAYRQRAERQLRQALDFLPSYYGLVAAELAVLALCAGLARRARTHLCWLRPSLMLLTIFDLAVFGLGLNPAISAELYGYEPPVIARLRQGLPEGGRAIGLGEELPPNLLMRFGLADARNYDSVELARQLAWLAPLYPRSSSPPSSRSAITWDGVIRARGRLVESGVGAIVAPIRPPANFESVEQVDRVWIAWLEARPWVESGSSLTRINFFRDDGRARIVSDSATSDRLIVRETWDPGWKGILDGNPVRIEPKWGIFQGIRLPPGHHELILMYDPVEVKIGLWISLCALVLVILVLTGIRLFWIPGITKARGLDGPEPPS
jgi:hypothetical protein